MGAEVDASPLLLTMMLPGSAGAGVTCSTGSSTGLIGARTAPRGEVLFTAKFPVLLFVLIEEQSMQIASVNPSLL
jgi:hypothetical protein